MEPYKFTVPVELTITRDVSDLPLAMAITWVDATSDDGEVRLDLTCGAGMGSSLLTGHAQKGTENAYAQASIKPFAQALFTELEAAARGQREERTPGTSIDRSLAFTALHDLKPWFRRLSMNAGSEVITLFLEDFYRYRDGRREAAGPDAKPWTIYEYAGRWGA